MNVTPSILALLRDLVAVPSRGGVDDYAGVIDVVERWLHSSGIATQRLGTPEGRVVALTATVGREDGYSQNQRARPCYALNATLDTAGFGDLESWSVGATSAEIRDGWLYGRGAADSKAGVAIFCHVARDIFARRDRLQGTLMLLFDADEHTGTFTGVRQFIAESRVQTVPDSVFIGYPGNERICVGSRGFERAVVTVHGRAAHSGASRNHGSNAVLRAARFADQLSSLSLPQTADPAFSLPPQLTVTAIHGGEDFSMVPGVCTLDIDVRLTPEFIAQEARAMIETAAATLDSESPDDQPTGIEWVAGWPAYRITDDEPVVQALRTAAAKNFGREIPTTVSGPSNVGNFLATIGVPALSGFGVTYRNIHAPNECVEIASIEPVYETYCQAVRSLLGMR